MSEGYEKPRGGGRQTRSYLMQMLEANGLRPRRQLGQNFLIDLNLLDLIVGAANLTTEDVVLEVGAGTGGLTSRLAAIVKRVVSLEIDAGFFALAQHETRNLDNVTLIHADALSGKNKLNPVLTDAVAAALKQAERDHFHLVANLPYDVAASVIGNLLVGDLPIRSLTFTVQFEMAERFAAAPGSKDYGPLTVLINQVGRCEWVRALPPDVFWPRPKIRSAIQRIEVDPARRENLDELRRFHRFVRDLFLHRRKIMRAAIASIPGYKALKPQLDAVLAKVGIPTDSRAEALSGDQLRALYRELAPLKQAIEEPDTAHDAQADESDD